MSNYLLWVGADDYFTLCRYYILLNAPLATDICRGLMHRSLSLSGAQIDFQRSRLFVIALMTDITMELFNTGLPFGATRNNRKFKLNFLDVGLVQYVVNAGTIATAFGEWPGRRQYLYQNPRASMFWVKGSIQSQRCWDQKWCHGQRLSIGMPASYYLTEKNWKSS